MLDVCVCVCMRAMNSGTKNIYFLLFLHICWNGASVCAICALFFIQVNHLKVYAPVTRDCVCDTHNISIQN